MAARKKPEPPPPYNPELRGTFEQVMAELAGRLQEAIVKLNQSLACMGQNPDWPDAISRLGEVAKAAVAAKDAATKLRQVVGPGFTSNPPTERDRAAANSLVNLVDHLSLDVSFLRSQVESWTSHDRR